MGHAGRVRVGACACLCGRARVRVTDWKRGNGSEPITRTCDACHSPCYPPNRCGRGHHTHCWCWDPLTPNPNRPLSPPPHGARTTGSATWAAPGNESPMSPPGPQWDPLTAWSRAFRGADSRSPRKRLRAPRRARVMRLRTGQRDASIIPRVQVGGLPHPPVSAPAPSDGRFAPNPPQPPPFLGTAVPRPEHCTKAAWPRA